MKSFFLKISTLALATLMVIGCTNEFEEINTNGNAPTEVPVSLLLPGVMRNMANQVVGTSWGIGNIVMQHTAKIQFVNEDRYQWDEVNGIWNTVYTNMRDVKNIYDLAEPRGQRNYMGLSLVMKSWMFSLVTDCYGDAPYSEATLGKSDVFFPVYDEQEAIYDGILADLETANELLGSSPESLDGDIIFGGDVMKWKKLTNSLHIRYLMRLSKRRDVSADLRKILDAPATYPIFEGNEDNAALTYLEASPNQFPLHTARVGSFDEFRLSKTLGDTLMALSDPRLFIFARPTAASVAAGTPEYVGVPNGLDDVEALAYNGGAQNVSRIGSYFYEDAITPEGISIAKGFIMDYAELQFILAEAAQKGLISGDAKTFYENGIEASFAFYGLEVPAGYLQLPEVAFASSTALEQIGFQKWIALFFHGVESWIDWRRTGIPTITPGKANLNDDRVPVRFIYPIIEQALNSENRNAAVSRQGTDNINTKLWFEK
ncbi:MAG: SusD/RagB family nutrient-binding outer membrane lipoprotein [Bacteroidia bacterium]|nr:SusD/RagB family nutrient-binding outer membrane lipoprotein [Bacteroidia bacterium]